MRVTINRAGLAEIRAFLEARHKLGHFTDDQLSAWARDAENHALEGNGVYIELPARDAISGHTEILDISPDGFDTVKLTAREIINSADFLADWYHDRLLGCGGQEYSRIYLDLLDMTLSESTTASCNEWLQRNDGSYREVASDNGWGADLTAEEKAWLEEDGISDFGYAEWLDNELEPAIQKALDAWEERQAAREACAA
nr:hypothetical protein [uncultured Ottowia sp.]